MRTQQIQRVFLILATVVITPLFLINGSSAAQIAVPVVLSTSPDGKFYLRRLQEDSTDRGVAQKRLEICANTGAVLYAWTSALGATTALWRPDSRLLALNDMPGNEGDLLWIFALDPEKCSAIPIREPNGKTLLSDAESRHGTFLSRIDHVHLRAKEWKDEKLWCQLDGFSTLKLQPAVHVPFHDLWVFETQGTNPPEIDEEWTRKTPKDLPYRDPSP